MDSVEGIASLQGLPSPHHLAIGVFDGLHLGHQAVWQRTDQSARQSAGTAVLVTFDPHPIQVLRPRDAPRILTHTAHKLRIAARLGIHHSLVIPFDYEVASWSGRAFIEALHRNSAKLAQICVGRDWQFGAGRSSNFELLSQLGTEFGFSATGVDPVEVDGEKISSTRIRHAIRSADLATASRLLGRDYSVLGDVMEGNRLGRQLGFPTANLSVHNEQLPGSGVYAVRASVGRSEPMAAVANLGHRPTVAEDAQRLLEVHLVDYRGPEFYGEEMEVWFVQALREERKFESLDALKVQIGRDVAAARITLGG